MPTKDELTKARDAALECINSGIACFLGIGDMRLGKCAGILSDSEITARICDRLGDLQTAKRLWIESCSSEVMDHIDLATARVDVKYEVNGTPFQTAHEASNMCAQMYLGPFELFISDEESTSGIDVDFILNHFKEASFCEPEDLIATVRAAWAEAVRQLGGPGRTDSAVSDESSLDEGDRTIVQALRLHGKRLKQEPLLEKAFGTVTGSGKRRCASLVKRGIIDKQRFGGPKGYGLPEWDGSTS